MVNGIQWRMELNNHLQRINQTNTLEERIDSDGPGNKLKWKATLTCKLLNY